VPDPLFFISHKHVDEDIAKVFADFINRQSGGRVRVHLSSNWKYEGARYGSLSHGLREALRESEALMLIYTNPDQNWDYCMYEWGVSQHEDSKPTRTILVHTTKSVPAPLSDEVRYNAAVDDDIRKFVDSFLTTPNFFPARSEAVTRYLPKSDQVVTASDELVVKLRSVIKPIPASKPVRLWPYVRLELPSNVLQAVNGAPAANRADAAKSAVEKQGRIVASNGRAAEIFGRAKIQDGAPFSEVLNSWRSINSDREEGWFHSLAMQVSGAAQGLIPEVRWACVTREGSDEEHLPVLNSTQEIKDGMQFDFAFYEFTALMRLPVTSKMIPREEMFCLVLDEEGIRVELLSAIIEKLDQVHRHRFPILSPNGSIRYMIHRATIDQYLVSKLIRNVDPTSLTLGRLLEEATSMKMLFEKSFVIVSSRTTLDEAKAAMQAVTECRDVLVTENGRADEPVIGWLTNLILA
jgi:hypothetical protein